MRAEDIIRRFDALKSDRSTVQDLWELIERFVVPFRGEFYRDLDNENEIEWRIREIYDSTAVTCAQDLAAAIQADLTNQSTEWFELNFRDDELNKAPVIRQWLEDSAKAIFRALNESNFTIESAETYLDLVSYGTSILIEEPEHDIDWKGINFQSTPIRECYFEENSKKQVKIFYRYLNWTPVQIVDKFGEDGVPTDMVDKAQNPGAATMKQGVVFCVYERDDKKGADTTQILAPKERPYGFKYILEEGKQELGEEGGYYEQPAFAVRWRKTAGSRWGHGPAAVAMGDILTLNQLKEGILQSMAKVIDPAILVEENGLFGDLELERGSLNVVADIDRIKPFESGARFDVGGMQVEWLQESIREIFNKDKLQLKESPAMTATEVNERRQRAYKWLGATLGRLQNDFLDPLIQRTFNIMYRAGQLPQIPEGYELSELDIDYTGPLAKAQKAQTSQAIQSWVGSIAQLAQVFPEAMDLVNVDEAVKTIALLDGVPAGIINDESKVEKVRKERNAKRAAAEKTAAIEAGGNAAQSVGNAAQAMNEGGVSEEDVKALSSAGEQAGAAGQSVQ